MALFRIETIKERGQARWSNRYYVNAADQAAAASLGQALAEQERLMSWNGVRFLGVRSSSAAADGRTGRMYQKTGATMGAVIMTNVLPIEVCVRFVFNPGPRQPGVKYYRFVVDGDEQDEGIIFSSRLTSLITRADAIEALATTVDALGGLYTEIGVDSRLHTHQMYRAWAARSGIDTGD